jgi:alpha-L-rhamnosidase
VSKDTSGDPVWDSGQVESPESVDIPCAGSPLARGRRYAWRVRVWDEDLISSDWSEPAWFEVELDPADGWRASWIGLGRIREDFSPPTEPGPPDPAAKALTPVPYLRRAFELDKPLDTVTSARLYVTALGLYEARLNGTRVGDAVLAPGWTDYAKRVAYQTYDVTGLLRQGENVIGTLLADGWYCGFVGFDAKRAGAHYGNAPELLAQVVITFADGTGQWVVTDRGWRGRFAAIRHADLLMGERHDLAAEPHGWDAAGFDDTGWRDVRCRDRDSRRLVADPAPPIRVTQDVAPRSIERDGAGRYIVDFGQNLPGWLKLRVGGPAGHSVRVRHAEVLAEDGTLYTENLRTARQTDEFITPGGAATFEPRFTLHGFRYAEISGYPGDLGPDDVTARVAHSDIPAAGSFQCSLEWLNQLSRNIDWGQRGNFISVPTDCPQRDERLGWLGDAQIFARTACYNRDVDKWLDDVTDAQLESGVFPDIAPGLPSLDWSGAPAWADAGVIIPWTLYQMYGDRGILLRHFTSMTAWMDYLEHANPGYLRTRGLGNSYNDWLAPGDDNTPPELLATAYWAYDAALMADIAAAVGRPAEADRYRALREKIGAAFAGAFVSSDGGMVCQTQTAYVLALHVGRRGDRARELPPDHGFRRRRLPAAGAQLPRLHPPRVPAARAAVAAILAVHDRPRRHHHLGTMGRLDERTRFCLAVDELVQPLRARFRRGVALPFRARHRARGGFGRLQPAGAAPASRWPAQLGFGLLSVGPRAGPHPLGAYRRPVHVRRRNPAEHDRQRPDPQCRRGPGPRRQWPSAGRPCGVSRGHRNRRGRIRGGLRNAPVFRSGLRSGFWRPGAIRPE